MKNRAGLLCLAFSLMTITDPLHAQWVKTNSPSRSITTLTASSSFLFAATDVGVYRSADNGMNWNSAVLANNRIDAVVVAAAGVFAGMNSDSISRSMDDGSSWMRVRTGLPSYLTLKTMLSANSFIFAGTRSGIYRSGDNGISWTNASTGLAGPGTVVSALAVKGTDLLAATDDGVYRSVDNGENWTALDPINLHYIGISALAVVGGNMCAASSGRGVYVSTDNGATWILTKNGFTNYGLSSLVASGSTVFAGSGSEIYRSTDHGLSWESTGSINNTVNTLVISNNYLVAGTVNGVWRRPLSELTAVLNGNTQDPGRFTLRQNYPNPFNPSTTISFSLPARSFVSLKVFDVMGREVSTIVADVLPAGNYMRQWNASGMPSGTYCCRLQAGSYTETKRLLLVK